MIVVTVVQLQPAQSLHLGNQMSSLKELQYDKVYSETDNFIISIAWKLSFNFYVTNQLHLTTTIHQICVSKS